MLCCACAALCGSPFAGQQRKSDKGAPRYQITGVAVSAKDGAAIPRCHLTAALTGGGNRGYGRSSAQTDADEQGRFVLEVPSDGNWSVAASARGYRMQQLDEHDGFFTGVVLTRSAPSYNLVFRAMPDGLLKGAVSDEAGEPVRNAQVRLFSVHPEATATDQSPLRSREATQTDDQGHYEFAGLEPGAYEVEVQARPWYATQRASSQSAAAADPSLDPSLDVVYPVTWYPGVDDAASADVLTMHAGEVRQADLRLRPVASAHLLIPAPGGVATGRGGGRGQPVVSQVMPDGSLRSGFSIGMTAGSNMMDVGGLAPGTYQVSRLPAGGEGDSGGTATVHVAAGGSTIEMGGATDEVTVTIAVDGGTQVDASEISLRDMATGRVLGEGGSGEPRGGPEGRGGGGPRMNQTGGQRPPGSQELGGRGQDQRGRGRRRGQGDTREATLTVPPGQYEVIVPGSQNVFLTGIQAKGAQAKGRVVTIQDGAPRLLVHLASGLAKVDGTAKMGGKASVGAMVLLVPATLGEPSSLTIVRRDQTNTDGSFRLEEVIPGQYILLAIDHGWEVNWSDAATLRPYLLHGVPLDLAPSALTHPVVQAVSP